MTKRPALLSVCRQKGKVSLLRNRPLLTSCDIPLVIRTFFRNGEDTRGMPQTRRQYSEPTRGARPALALAELDAGFLRVRFDRPTATEKRYLRAMAELGPGRRLHERRFCPKGSFVVICLPLTAAIEMGIRRLGASVPSRSFRLYG